MRDYDPEELPPALLTGAPRVLVSLALLATTLAMTVPIYGGWLSGGVEDVFRFGLPLLLGAGALAARRGERLRAFQPLLWSLFGVSLGFALAHVLGGQPLDWFGLSATTPQGATVAKVFSEVLPISAAILFAAYLARADLRSLGLVGGRVGLSLGLGLLASVPLVALSFIDPTGGIKAVLALPASTLLSWLPWIAVFSLANGFMEELWFRGSWLSSFRQAVGSSAAMHVTSVAFCAMHVIVYLGDPVTTLVLTPVWLFMGYAYAVTMRKTRSLWGPVLAHAIADVLYMYIYFALA
jgi:membrane protease YdiL (CAAX protease family)